MSIVDHFMAYTAAHGLRVPAAPSVHGGALSQTGAYAHVARLARDRRARVDGMLSGRPAPHGLRLDAAAKDAVERRLDAATVAYTAEWAEFFRDMDRDGARADALVPVASQALVSFYSTVYDIQHNDLPAWDKRILKVDTRVDPAAGEYVWYERDIVGVAQASSSYDHTTIPMVAGPAAQANRGLIVPALVGMEVNFMEPRREALARRNGKPDFQIDQGKIEACKRALAEFFNALWLYGDATMGIDGLFNSADISDMTLPGLPWASKTALQILDDLGALINAIPNRTGGQLGDRKRIRIVLPPDQFQRASMLPVTASGDKSVLEYFRETWGLKPDQVTEEFSFASANSAVYNGGPLGLARDTGLIVYDQGSDDKDPMFILSQPIEVPAPARQTGLGEVVYYHARGGGIKVPDGRAIIRVSGGL